MDPPKLTIRRQCQLLGIERSSVYYEPVPESSENVELMRLIDQEHLEHPARGSRQMVDYLTSLGSKVNRRRIQRWMRRMGVAAIAPKPQTTVPAPGHRVYPYLLRGLTIERPNQVSCSDTTYVPMTYGIMHLVAVMDWFSRRVLSWKLAKRMDADFCIEAVLRIDFHGVGVKRKADKFAKTIVEAMP